MNYKEETINAYNKGAETFAKKFKERFDLKRRKEFQIFINNLPGKKILDLGCGAGDHSLYFKEQGLDVTSIDLSDEMIKLAKQKGLNAIKMDIEDLKFNANTFDGIWAACSLQHVQKKDLPRVLFNLRDILKDKGILFINVFEGEGEENREGKFGRRFFSYWKEEELMSILEKDFDLINFYRASRNERVFLHFHLKKK